MAEDWSAAGLANRAVAKARAKELRPAIGDAMAACVIEPGQARFHAFLSTIKGLDGDLSGAIVDLGKAICIDPADIKQKLTLGELLRRSGRVGEALDLLRNTVVQAPDDWRVWVNYGVASEFGWRSLDAALAFRRAACLRPDRVEFLFRDLLTLPALPRSIEDITVWRRRYEKGVERLERLPMMLENPIEKLGTPVFYLAYHNEDDRVLMEALRRMFRATVPGLSYRAGFIENWAPPDPTRRRIRVGFISEYFSDHTIGKLYKGLLRHIDRRRFEIFLIHTPGARDDDFRARLENVVDRALTLPAGWDEQCRVLSGLELDVLFFPDIGMSASTYFLAHGRYAPVQAVAWGHPNTTGLDTVDYFISSAVLEPEHADRYYTERLVKFAGLPCCYEPPIGLDTVAARESFGLPETGVLYACPQSLFKLHPEFDAVLAEIAERDPGGHIVFLTAQQDAQTNQLLDRWAVLYPVLLERSIFLPRQSFPRFMELMGVVDVLLDPIHFGSGNTMYEAMVHGTPIVTWPGRFMRSRIVAAAYARMEISDAPVVTRIADYAAKAVSLGQDSGHRADLCRRSRIAAREKLFSDLSFVREFEAFLTEAVETRGAGQLLSVGWSPSRLTGSWNHWK